jgi:hypothetical protein
MILVIDNKKVEVGQEVTSFRGEKYILTGWKEPHKPSSTGRVYLKLKDGSTFEFYPEVINAKFIIETTE